MGSRTLPTECEHGVTVDYGDFGPCQDCDEHDGESCPNFVDCEQCATESHEALVRRLCPIDLGSEHGIGWTATGDLHWMHWCTDPNYYGGVGKWSLGTIDVTSGTKHTLRKRLPVDVGGSVLCPGCGDHGFINDGQWVKC